MLDVNSVRKTVLSTLNKAIGVTVILADQTAKQPPYPFVELKATMLGKKVGRPTKELKTEGAVHEQHIEMTFSISCLGGKIGEAEKLAYEALQFFEVDGVLLLQDQNIAIVQTTDLTDRTTFLTVGYEYKVGFDVRLRAKARVVSTVETIESVEIKGGL